MREYYLKRADDNLPHIIKKVIVPNVKVRKFETDDSTLIDLGNHYVGYFSFKMTYDSIYIDAPVKLKIRFAEVKRELDDDYSQYKGYLSPSWFQEEIINIDFPGEVHLPRRYAARYIKITVVNTPRTVVLSDFEFESQTSYDTEKTEPLKISDESLINIDKVSINTLKNCMQRVYEDGPKRDRRLWIGDMRLEALTGYELGVNTDIIKRCLYLFAASKRNKDGFMASFVYENPIFVSGETNLIDYALLYVVSVCDYYEYTKDKDTVSELLEVCFSQVDAAEKCIDDYGIMTKRDYWYAFIDWCPGIEPLTALHGVYLYTLERFFGLLKNIGNEKYEIYKEKYIKYKNSAKKHLWNEDMKLFVNKYDNEQLSVHSQVWMILSGVIDGEEAKNALEYVLNSKDSKKPTTPYMQHYVAECYVKLGMLDKAKEHIKSFWGKMVDDGADTFYEIYDPNDKDFSPYEDRMINSMCHAWSCTPSYFIRKYFNE